MAAAQQGDRRRPGHGVVPDGQERAHEPLRELGQAACGHGRDYFGRVEGRAEDAEEQALLGAEVVVDEGGVHPGGPGYVAYRRPVITALGEKPAGGVEHRLPGARAARAPPCPCHSSPGRGSGGPGHHAVRRRSVTEAKARATTAAPTTMPRSRHISAVGLANIPTCCRPCTA